MECCHSNGAGRRACRVECTGGREGRSIFRRRIQRWGATGRCREAEWIHRRRIGRDAGPLGIGLESFYSQRGVSSQTGANSRELEYLDFLGLVRASIPTPGIAPYAFAGPQISYELACNAGAGSCPGGDRTQWPKAGVIGAGVALGGDNTVTVEARYIYGLEDLALETVTSEESYRERSFALLAGIAF